MGTLLPEPDNEMDVGTRSGTKQVASHRLFSSLYAVSLNSIIY